MVVNTKISRRNVILDGIFPLKRSKRPREERDFLAREQFNLLKFSLYDLFVVILSPMIFFDLSKMGQVTPGYLFFNT